jgi:hypothetical protein
LSQGGVKFYWRYSHEGRTHREPIGIYDPVSPPKKLEPTSRGFSVAAAHEQCRRLSQTHSEHRTTGGLKEAKLIERKQYQAAKEAAAVRDMQAFERTGDHVFSTKKGIKPISGTTLSGWAVQAVGDAVEGFQLKRVRSGVETLLAAHQVSREIRGYVQSHGLTGIQARHYDDYMLEKRHALEVLAIELQAAAARTQKSKAAHKVATTKTGATR